MATNSIELSIHSKKIWLMQGVSICMFSCFHWIPLQAPKHALKRSLEVVLVLGGTWLLTTAKRTGQVS